MKIKLFTKEQWAWSFYDWANSSFATTVMAGFFPLFFKKFWTPESQAADSTYFLGMTNSLAGLVIVISAPVLGAIADSGGRRKFFLSFFTIFGVVGTCLLFWVPQNHFFEAAICYSIGAIGFAGAIIFYDSMMVDVCEEKDFHLVSALGYSMGYLGGGLLFLVNVLMTLKPDWFGFKDAAEGVKWSFITVGVWWLVFTVPFWLCVRQKGEFRKVNLIEATRLGFGQLAMTAKKLKNYKNVGLFLLAYWFYIDGVNTIIKMAVDYGMSLGFNSNSLIVALLITQFVGFPAALLFGPLGNKWGAKKALYLGIAVYVGVTAWGYNLQNESEFYLMAIAIGLVQGGIQSVSRSFYGQIIPQEYSSEFFGFFNMMGKFAAIMGPFLMGVASHLTGSVRLSILTILILFAIGFAILTRVQEPKLGTSNG